MKIIQIANFLISPEIISERFVCDLEKCHGVCCIIGDSGAPLSKGECRILKKESNSISKFIRPSGVVALKRQGIYIKDSDGDLVTPLINGEECAYTVFDDKNNCLCGIEFAHRAGKSSLFKPDSCWLYPIRVSHLSNGMTALNLHRWHICRDAFAKGAREDIPVYRFLKDPIIRIFGEELYLQLTEIAGQFNK